MVKNPRKHSSAVLLLMLATVVVATQPAGAAEEPVTFYVQVIRATDSDKAPVAGAKLIGPKLSAKLAPVFHWKYYWEIKRLEVAVAKEKRERVKLPGGLEVEIFRSKDDKREIQLYREGKLTRKVTQPAGELMSILGGSSESESGWFVVVRRDKPSLE